VLAAPAVAPLAFVRRPHQHRYQAWAPKLSRCIVLASWSAVQLWVMLEAQPRVKSYCVRPAVAVIDGQERLIDFWVQLDNQEQWFVIQAEGEPILDLEVGGTQAPSVEGGCVQFVSPQSFEEHAVWIENWLSILPYLASTSRLVEPALVAQVVEPCRKAMALGPSSRLIHATIGCWYEPPSSWPFIVASFLAWICSSGNGISIANS
jgi:hypothetical protein